MIAQQQTTQTMIVRHSGGGMDAAADPLTTIQEDLASVLTVLEGARRGHGHLRLDGPPRVENLVDGEGARREWVVFPVVGGSLDIINDPDFPNPNRLRREHMYHALGSVRALQGVSDDGLLQP